MRVFAHKLAILSALAVAGVPAYAHPHHSAVAKGHGPRQTTHAAKRSESQVHTRHTPAQAHHRSVSPVSAKRHRQAPETHTVARVAPIEQAPEPIYTRHNRKVHHAPVPEIATTRVPNVLMIVPPMKGSHEILIHQNVMADSEGLSRVQDDLDLERMRADRSLVLIPDTLGLQTDDRLPSNRRFCRPWTATFLTAMARAHYQRFHTPMQVNSAVRTVEFQQKLLRINGNAAPAEGDTASPHLTGQAVDIAKHGLSSTEIAWMRGYLLPLVQQGKIDVEEEFQQACFHISVYRQYVPGPVIPREIAQTHRGAATVLAAALR